MRAGSGGDGCSGVAHTFRTGRERPDRNRHDAANADGLDTDSSRHTANGPDPFCAIDASAHVAAVAARDASDANACDPAGST